MSKSKAHTPDEDASAVSALRLPTLASWPLMAKFPDGCLPRHAVQLDTPQQWKPEQKARAAAVFMLLLPPTTPGAPASVLLTKRTTTVRTHKGQIGFPGGRRETSDSSPLVTALREAQEELAIPPASVHPLGALPPLPALDGGLVIPLLGLAAVSVSDLSPSPDEVESIILAPWPHLGRSASSQFHFKLFGRLRHSHLFYAPSDAGDAARIWGLTATIVHSAHLS